MEYKSLLFTSYEIHPVNPGGCGVFLWNAVKNLLQHNEFKIILLLDIPKYECELFEKKYKNTLPNNENLDIICLSEIINELPLNISSFNNLFLYKSYQFYKGIEFILKDRKVDYIEFFDYVGIGYFTIRAKKYENQFSDTKIAIRGHCTIDLMDLEQNQIDFSKEKVEMYQMEQLSLRDADYVILQSKSWDKIYINRYNVKKEKIIVSPPPMDNHDFPKFDLNNNSQNVLFYGRVFQLKGIDQFIDAGILYLSRNKDSCTKFYIVGYDSMNYKGNSYKDYLLERIPNEYRDKFIFTGKLDRVQFKDVINDIKVAVFPNYVESFCYSIHELYESGIPIICKTIPAFDDYFTDLENCLKYDGTIIDLYKKINLLLNDKELQTKISFPYRVLNNENFVDTYKYILSDNSSKVYFENITDEKISVILISEKECLSHPIFNNPGISNKSYIMTQYSTSNIEIEFLGEKYKILGADEVNNDLTLERYVLIMNSLDNIEYDFLQRGLKILKNTDASFVTSAFRNNDNNIIFNKLDLLCENFIERYDSIQTIMIDFEKELTIRDIFDFRLEGFGQAEVLSKIGYIIPEVYNNFSNHFKIKKNMSNRVLYYHRKDRFDHWKPTELLWLLNVNEEYKNNKEKEIYHELRQKTNSMSGFRGKIYKKVVDIIHKIITKR